MQKPIKAFLVLTCLYSSLVFGIQDSAPLTNGLYKTKDESMLKIGNVNKNGFVLFQAFNQNVPECSLVKGLKFKLVSPNLYVWSKDKCQMIITKLIDSNSIVLTVNKMNSCFQQYDNDQPFTCFGDPMTIDQGLFITGRTYNLDTNPNDNINN